MFQMTSGNAPSDARWLTGYYTTRAGVSLAWVGAAFLAGSSPSPLTAALLVVYPAWDAMANLADSSRNGGLSASPTQVFNVVVSTIVALTVLFATRYDPHAVLYIFGVWASLSGILQLATAVRRRRGFSAQWAMILSGAQSAVAGVIFLKRAGVAYRVATGVDIAPYAAFGAAWFLIAAVALAISAARHTRNRQDGMAVG